ncbi:unnamed protein product [Pleuronectes platessa]|uniref:Uncharacterized protein n=1 Tax=Pleuronectes platessa TaxID=8262 RepID=A0A9N7YLT8_PLEPL|nr:unnamed protein product [Pleuronectes platessa]
MSRVNRGLHGCARPCQRETRLDPGNEYGRMSPVRVTPRSHALCHNIRGIDPCTAQRVKRKCSDGLPVRNDSSQHAALPRCRCRCCCCCWGSVSDASWLESKSAPFTKWTLVQAGSSVVVVQQSEGADE